MTLLNGILPLHDVDDAERFCRRILESHLAKSRATLRPHDREDCLAYLVAECWQLSERYNPDLNTSFSKYAYQTLQRKVVDWYRTRFAPRDQQSEGWYKRLYPGSQDRSEQRANVFFPSNIDLHTDTAAVEPGQDPVVFAVRARNLDIGADCAPALFDALTRGFSETPRRVDIPDPGLDDGVEDRDRKAA